MEDIPGREPETGSEHQTNPDTEGHLADDELDESSQKILTAYGNEHGSEHANNGDSDLEEGIQLAIDFTVLDAAANPWTLSDHLDSAAVITFHRGDF